MLKVILKRYLFYAVILNVFLIFQLRIEYSIVYLFNFLALFIYYALLKSKLNKTEAYYSSIRLVLDVCAYSSIYVVIINVISHYYNGNFFVFSDKDAVVYHLESIKILEKGYVDGIEDFLLDWSFEDLGVILYTSFLYKLVASNLIVNLANLVIGVMTSILMFRIGSKFMSIKYAYLASLSYSISSFVLWFHSSGLKETLLMFFILLAFDQYYRFVSRKSARGFVIFLLSLACIFLFRPAISALIFISILLTLVLVQRRSLGKILILPLILIIAFFLQGYVTLLLQKFVGEDIGSMLARKDFEGMIIINLPFTILTNIMSSLIGPFSTVIPTGAKAILSFYSVGLMFKTLLSCIFWMGVYYAFKRQYTWLYPLIIYFLLEAFSLAFILEALELRKSLPHVFVVYLVSFWFMDYFQRSQTLRIGNKRRLMNILESSSVISFILLAIWNLRGL